ncbi:hypothetical protein ACF0H5_005592 [Mactra antiquata]
MDRTVVDDRMDRSEDSIRDGRVFRDMRKETDNGNLEYSDDRTDRAERYDKVDPVENGNRSGGVDKRKGLTRRQPEIVKRSTENDKRQEMNVHDTETTERTMSKRQRQAMDESDKSKERKETSAKGTDLGGKEIIETTTKRQKVVRDKGEEVSDDFDYIDDIQLTVGDSELTCAVETILEEMDVDEAAIAADVFDERVVVHTVSNETKQSETASGDYINEDRTEIDKERERELIEMGRNDNIQREGNDDDSEHLSSESSNSSSSENSSNTLKGRAIELLSKGVMPLCPPARRVWNRNIEFEIDNLKITWPPKNWKELNAESKLFAMEQMALLLERKNSPEFPKISKKLLCDKYAFLMLDGQEKPNVSSSESEKLGDKIRQYNAAYLRGIINNEILDSRVSWSIIKSLENAQRWTDTDDICDVLENGGVKLKY